MPRTWSMELDVVGLRFRWTKDGRKWLAKLVSEKDITGIRLVREPDNRHDPNAVMVMLPERLNEGRQLGYLHRHTAEMLAPKLDSGSVQVSSAKLVALDDRDDYNSGTILVRFRDVPVKRAAKGKTPAKGKMKTSA